MNLFLLLVQYHFGSAVETALGALGFTTAQVPFGHIRANQFARAGHFEAFGRGFVCFQLGH